MIFDLLTSPQGYQFDPRVKFYLHSLLLEIPVNLLCHMTMFKKNFFYPLGTTSPTKSYLWDMTQVTFDIKFFEFDFVIEI